MPRTRRYFKSNSLYEIIFRAREGLPFACTRYMRLIANGILARVQRDNKVILHHFLLEGSHPHIICTAKDANQCQKFYGQFQKQLTDAIKRLLGRSHLSIWEGRASVIEIPTLNDAISKIGYLYANPSNDDLETCIEQYPGISSWPTFLEAESIDEAVCSEHPWIQLPMIPTLSSTSVTAREDDSLCRQMLSLAKKSHVLEVYPNLWIMRFIDNPTAEDLADVNKRILEDLRLREKANNERREKSKKSVLGAARLRKQPLLSPHTPKKNSRKIFVQSIYKEIRLQIIAELRQIDALCREVYRLWKQGDFSVPWPPGTFPPPLPPMANAISF